MLHEALRLIRVYHDLKQSEAAVKLGISKSYLSEIEKGVKTPTLEIIEKYSKAFSIPASSIMFFSESIDSKDSYKKARTFVAGKVINLLKFLEERGEAAHAE